MKWLRLVLILFLLGGLGMIYYNLTFPLPKPETKEVWLPANYELHKNDDIEPGTFKIKRNLTEFQALARDEKILVVYQAPIHLGAGSAYVEYWKSRGDGTFDYHRTTIQPSGLQPKSGVLWANWKVSFDGRNFTLSPVRELAPSILGGFISALSLIYLWGLRSKSKPKKAHSI